MYICLCNAITDRQIVRAALEGARTPHDLAHNLGVGLGCGRCVACAKDLLVNTVARLTAAPGGLAPTVDGERREG